MFDKLGAMLLEHAWGDQPWFEDAVGAVTMIRMVIAGWFAWERHREGGTSRLRVANTMETILRAAIHDFIRTSAAVDTRNVA